MSAPRVLIYGGKGALGSAIVGQFKKNGAWVASVDLFANEEADTNILLKVEDSWESQEEAVCSALGSGLGGEQLQAVLCVAGGWAGGNAASADFLKNTERMVKQSIWPSIIASKVAATFMAPGGMLVLPGAQPAVKGTPGMIGYGMAKAAVHQLVASLAADGSGMPEGSNVAAILPVTLDTPMNRKFMPDADQSKWTPLEFVSDLLCKWTNNKERPANGSLVQLLTEGGETELKNA